MFMVATFEAAVWFPWWWTINRKEARLQSYSEVQQSEESEEILNKNVSFQCAWRLNFHHFFLFSFLFWTPQSGGKIPPSASRAFFQKKKKKTEKWIFSLKSRTCCTFRHRGSQSELTTGGRLTNQQLLWPLLCLQIWRTNVFQQSLCSASSSCVLWFDFGFSLNVRPLLR